MIRNVIAISVFLFMSSCNAQITDNERIYSTINKIAHCVNSYDTMCVQSLYVMEGKTGKDIVYDIQRAYYFMTKYHDNKIDSLRYEPDSVYDDLGRMRFTIHLYNGFDSLTGITNADLNIYLGPKQLFGYEKITGFELQTELIPAYRNRLRLQGKLLTMDEILKQIEN